MTDRLSGEFLDASPAVGEDSYGLFYPYDGALDLRYATAEEAWEWYQNVLAADGEIDEATGAYVVRVRIEKVEGF